VAISYRIVDDMVFTEMGASFSLDDVRAYLAAVLGDPSYRSGMPSLVDCRHVTALLSPADLRVIAADIASVTTAPVSGRCAVLAATASTDEVRAFRDEDEAMAWLNVTA